MTDQIDTDDAQGLDRKAHHDSLLAAIEWIAQHHQHQSTEATALSGIPLGQMAEPTELAELVAFVLRPSQASLTGAVLDVNGASQMRS